MQNHPTVSEKCEKLACANQTSLTTLLTTLFQLGEINKQKKPTDSLFSIYCFMTNLGLT